MSARTFVQAGFAALVLLASARASVAALGVGARTAAELATAVPFALTAPVQGGNASFKVPANDGWVTDLANLLTPAEERELETSLEAFKRASGHDIALLTVPDLGGRTIEEYTLAVGREWKLGTQERKDGAVLVVAKSERKLRIEVGEGLEGTFTDARASQIIRNTITPEFKAGRFSAGLRAGLVEMQAAALGREASSAGGIGQSSGRDPARGKARAIAALWGSLCPVLMIVFIAIIVSRAARRGGRGGRGGFGGFGGLGPFVGGRGLGGRSSFGGGGGFSGFGGGGRFGGGGASGGW